MPPYIAFLFGAIAATVCIYILYKLNLLSFKLSHNFLVRALNLQKIGFSGITISQSLRQAGKFGGRMNYYIYPNPRVFAGANIIPFAISLHNGYIQDIYLSSSVKITNLLKHSNIGGYFDSLSLAKTVNFEHEPNYFNQHLPAKKYNNAYYSGQAHTHDIHPSDNLLREVKEELNWNIQKSDLLSLRPLVVTEHKEKNTPSYFLLHTSYFCFFTGIIKGGHLVDEVRNININNYTTKGYDDIKEVNFFSLASIKKNGQNYSVNGKIIKKRVMDEVYQASALQIIGFLCEKYFNSSIFEIKKTPLGELVNKFEANLLDNENNSLLFKSLGKINIK